MADHAGQTTASYGAQQSKHTVSVQWQCAALPRPDIFEAAQTYPMYGLQYFILCAVLAAYSLPVGKG